jgi:hypothetical protein
VRGFVLDIETFALDEVFAEDEPGAARGSLSA